MIDTAAAAPSENVGRGLLFATGSIVLGIVGFAIVSGVIGIYGWVTGIVAIAIPYSSIWLYRRGAGTAPKQGQVAWIGLTALAVIVGAATSLVAGAYAAFSAVGGDGGLFAPAFWRTVSNLATNLESLFPALIALVVGDFGIFSALRGPRVPARTPAAPPSAAPTAPPAPNAPSPGVLLNGEPLDPDAKR